ncbi:MAG TPA: DUF6232 family protein [Methylophilus sp.]|nr:DUF6232 family protein [Methylophilus sp.]
MEETNFFSQDNVSVSNSRFIVNGQTYAMSNVTSVKSGVTPPNRGAAILLILVGLLCFLGSGTAYIIGFGLIFAGAIAWSNAKAQYSVILNTSAGENQALTSEDSLYIEKVIHALNAAIVSRG